MEKNDPVTVKELVEMVETVKDVDGNKIEARLLRKRRGTHKTWLWLRERGYQDVKYTEG